MALNLRLSEAGKSNVDIILPTVGAGLAFYYLKERQGLKMERLLIYTGIAFVFLYVITSQLTKSIRNQTIAPADVPRENPNEYSPIPNEQFNASAYSDRLYNDTNGIRWGQFFNIGTDEELYKELAVMSNDQLIQVANQWKRDYYQKTGETLIQALEGETYNNFFTGTQDRVEGIITRLRSLGFN